MQHRGDRNGPFPGVMVHLLRFNSVQDAHPAVRKVRKKFAKVSDGHSYVRVFQGVESRRDRSTFE